MASKAKVRTTAPRFAPGDLEGSIREAVQTAPGSTSAQLMKQLPASYRGFSKEVQACALRLANAGEIHRHLKGKTALFFPTDPIARLDAVIPAGLADEALDKDSLKRLVDRVAPGHGVVLDAWLRRALERKLLYEQAPLVKGSKKRYGPEPDLRKVVAPLISALRKARDKLDGQGIPRERLAELLLGELGVRPTVDVSAAGKPSNGGNGRSSFLSALAALGSENPRQALLSVRDLRSRLPFGKAQFDALALELMRDGVITLHHHDHPASLPAPEREQLVSDAHGTYYVGIAPRRGT